LTIGIGSIPTEAERMIQCRLSLLRLRLLIDTRLAYTDSMRFTAGGATMAHRVADALISSVPPQALVANQSALSAQAN
jgi:hypothetical protein